MTCTTNIALQKLKYIYNDVKSLAPWHIKVLTFPDKDIYLLH